MLALLIVGLTAGVVGFQFTLAAIWPSAFAYVGLGLMIGGMFGAGIAGALLLARMKRAGE